MSSLPSFAFWVATAAREVWFTGGEPNGEGTGNGRIGVMITFGQEVAS